MISRKIHIYIYVFILFSVAELEDPILLEDMTVLNPCMVVILPALQRHLRPTQPMEFSVPYRQLLHLQVHQSWMYVIIFTKLDRHRVWPSHDPTSIQTFDFCEKRCHTAFFKKEATFCRLHLFLSHLLKRHNFTAQSSSSRLSDASQSD